MEEFRREAALRFAIALMQEELELSSLDRISLAVTYADMLVQQLQRSKAPTLPNIPNIRNIS